MSSVGKKFTTGILKSAERAAIAASQLIGGGDKEGADQLAVDAMRTALNEIEFDGRIVIGEGERDEAPMLYIGEKVGTGNGDAVDIALDPLEGTNFAANNLPGALSVIAIAAPPTVDTEVILHVVVAPASVTELILTVPYEGVVPDAVAFNEIATIIPGTNQSTDAPPTVSKLISIVPPSATRFTVPPPACKKLLSVIAIFVLSSKNRN